MCVLYFYYINKKRNHLIVPYPNLMPPAGTTTAKCSKMR